MRRRAETLALLGTAAAMCLLGAWSFAAVLEPDAVLAFAALFTLC